MKDPKGRPLLGLLSFSRPLCFWFEALLVLIHLSFFLSFRAFFPSSASGLLLGLFVNLSLLLPFPSLCVFCLSDSLCVPLSVALSVWLLMHHLQVGPVSENGAGVELPYCRTPLRTLPCSEKGPCFTGAHLQKAAAPAPSSPVRSCFSRAGERSPGGMGFCCRIGVLPSERGIPLA